jgi:SWI/SNF-related matrix-associated actin-dependent regulator 1 of chromatin subfamily A
LAKEVPYVIGLSGTPILNRPSEIYNAVRIINPEIFPVFDDFARRYCNRRYNGFGWDNSGSSNIHELHEILTHTIMIRRLKKDVMTDLPDKIYNFVPIELSNPEEYRSAENDLISFIRAEKGALAAIKAKSAEALVKIEVMKQLAAKGKLQQAIEWIHDFLESDGKLVLFATHKTIIQNLVDEFGPIAVRFDGSMTDVQKQKAKEEFQTNPEIKLFIGNIKAASEGITLTAASTVAFLEYPWSPGLLVQCADRCHRIGQKDNVTIHYLLAEGTIDEKIARLLDSKKIVLSQMIDGVEVEQETLLTEIMKMYENV